MCAVDLTHRVNPDDATPESIHMSVLSTVRSAQRAAALPVILKTLVVSCPRETPGRTPSDIAT